MTKLEGAYKIAKETDFLVIPGMEVSSADGHIIAKQLPDTLKVKYPELPWKEITGMRDKLIHAYFGMDTETIWETIKHNIPALKQTIQKIKKDQE